MTSQSAKNGSNRMFGQHEIGDFMLMPEDSLLRPQVSEIH